MHACSFDRSSLRCRRKQQARRGAGVYSRHTANAPPKWAQITASRRGRCQPSLGTLNVEGSPNFRCGPANPEPLIPTRHRETPKGQGDGKSSYTKNTRRNDDEGRAKCSGGAPPSPLPQLESYGMTFGIRSRAEKRTETERPSNEEN